MELKIILKSKIRQTHEEKYYVLSIRQNLDVFKKKRLKIQGGIWEKESNQ